MLRRKGTVFAVVITALLTALITFLLVFLWVQANKPAPRPKDVAHKDLDNPLLRLDQIAPTKNAGQKQRLSALGKRIHDVLSKGGIEELDLDHFGTPWRGQRPKRFERKTGDGEKGTTEGPDVFLFVVDTQRADLTGPGGNGPETTPFFSEIAAQGVLFTRAISPSSWTAPAMFSLMTGLYPSEHGITGGMTPKKAKVVVGQKTLPDEATMLAELLVSAGYDTYGVCTNFHMNPRSGFAQGFDHYVGGEFETLPFPNLAVAAISDQVKKPRKSFVWVHYFDPHFPYEQHLPWFHEWNDTEFTNRISLASDLIYRYYRAKENLSGDAAAIPSDVSSLTAISKLVANDLGLISLGMRYAKDGSDSPHTRYLRAAYRSELRASDEAVRKDFEQLGVDDNSIVILTSDHGEELFDHEWNGHRHSLYQELLHVPLAIRLPGGKHAGTVIDTPVSLIDFVPTVLDLIGEEIPEELQGRSLVPLIEGKAFAKRNLYSETMYLKQEYRTIIQYPWKLIVILDTNHLELYHLAQDPGETNNLAALEPERAERMRADLLKWTKTTKLKWDVKTAPLAKHEVQRLKALGYIN